METSEKPRRKLNLSYEETITPDVEEETVTETPQLTEQEISTNNTIIDDWLGLDQSNNRSIVLGPHMNRSFFGFVELEDKSGNFEET